MSFLLEKINAIILSGGTRVGDEVHIVEGTPEPGIPRPAQPFRMSFRERREIVCTNIFFLWNFITPAFLPSANEVCEGYVLTPVCQSFCSQEGCLGPGTGWRLGGLAGGWGV